MGPHDEVFGLTFVSEVYTARTARRRLPQKREGNLARTRYV